MPLRITPINDEAAIDGTWTIYRGVRLCIARANNEKFKNTFLRLSKGYKNPADMSEEVAQEVLCKSMTCTVLTDWDDFDINGEKVEFNKDNCFELLKQDTDCRDYVLAFAQDIENYLEEEHAEVVGK